MTLKELEKQLRKNPKYKKFSIKVDKFEAALLKLLSKRWPKGKTVPEVTDLVREITDLYIDFN